MTTTPTSKAARIQELDLFRGFAIFGIFMVNILVMNMSFAYRGEWEAEQTGWLNQISFFILENLFYSKFFAMFSFLFGMGVALQMKIAQSKGQFSNAFFLRRFGSLFLFGVAHILFLWSGDILHLYGMLGVILLVLFRGPPKFLLIAALVVFIFPLYPVIFETVLARWGVDPMASLNALSREEILELKHHGSYWSGIILRLKEYAFASNLIYAGIAPIALTMMLLGGYFVKAEWLENLSERLNKAAPALWIAFILLTLYRLTLIYWVVPNFEIDHGSALSIFLIMLFQVSDISITFMFLWILGTLWNKGIAKKLLSPLRYVGRMAFTNYILQSLLGYWIMRTLNGYEYFSAYQCILLVVAIYTIQIFLSKEWLSRFKFGPLEWLWRCISYRKLLPIR